MLWGNICYWTILIFLRLSDRTFKDSNNNDVIRSDHQVIVMQRSSGQQRATEFTCIWTSQKCLLGSVTVTGFPQPTSYIHGSSAMSSCPLALSWIIYTMRVRSDAMKACVDGWLGHRQQWLMWVKQLEQWVQVERRSPLCRWACMWQQSITDWSIGWYMNWYKTNNNS